MQQGVIVWPYGNRAEIGGAAFAGMLSNASSPVDKRSTANSLARAGSQVMWGTVPCERKKFSPDIRRMWQHIDSHAVRAGKSGR